jgi:hypothetical protein
LTRTRSFLVCILTLGALTGSVASAQAACDEWTNTAGGLWGTAGDWSKGVPTGETEVCITKAGSYTVTLAPYQGELKGQNGDGVKSLTLGGSGGSQTLEISGQSSNPAGDQLNVTVLGVAGTANIGSSGHLVLDGTGLGTPGATPATEQGGAAEFSGAIVNDGSVVSEVQDGKWPTNKLDANLTNDAGGTVQVSSGTLNQLHEGEGSAPWATTNNGSITVDAGAALFLNPSFAGVASFTNDASIVNDGSITLNGSSGTSTWTQSGGSVSGNAVVIENGATLADSTGAGQFLLNHGSGSVTGTIPIGQTVTVEGSPNFSGGETSYSNTLLLDNATLVNDGTLVLSAPGEGEAGGGSVYVQSGAIQNNASMLVRVAANPSRRLSLEAGLTNGPSGTLDVQSGELDQGSGTPATNEGLLLLAPGAQYFLTEGSTFANAGTLAPEIASAASYGSFEITSACCNGSATFTAGGVVAPRLVGGFVPATNQGFEVFRLGGGHFLGGFAAGGEGFTPDYSHASYETSSPAFVSVVYHDTGGSGSPAATAGVVLGPASIPLARVVSISSAHGKLAVKLSCPAGGAACRSVSIQATVTEHLKGGKITAVVARKAKKKARTTTKLVVIATGESALVAGATGTVSLALNATGRALLEQHHKLATVVKVSSGTNTLEARTIKLQQPVKGKKK